HRGVDAQPRQRVRHAPRVALAIPRREAEALDAVAHRRARQAELLLYRRDADAVRELAAIGKDEAGQPLLEMLEGRRLADAGHPDDDDDRHLDDGLPVRRSLLVEQDSGPQALRGAGRRLAHARSPGREHRTLSPILPASVVGAVRIEVASPAMVSAERSYLGRRSGSPSTSRSRPPP